MAMATKPKRKSARKGRGPLHFFVPTRQNGRHPHLLRKEVVMGAIALILAVEVGYLAQTLVFSHGESMTASVLPAALTDLTNQQRTENNLPTLETNPLLTEAAQDKANDMAAKGYFAHVSPSGQLPWYWFGQVGYNYQFAGENLAINFTDSSDVVNAWMNSPMHRANILKQDYTQIGIGIAQGEYQGQETTFVVQFFGTPESAPVRAPTSAPVAKAPAPAPSVTQPAQVNPTVPLETAAPTAEPSVTSPQGEVLGTQTPAPTLSPIQNVLASPRTYMTYFLLILAAIFITLLLLSFVPRTFKFSQYLPHTDALLNGGALVATIVGVLILNQSLVSNVQLNSDSQHASVEAALVR